VILGGERMTGAARLASEAAMRVGSGLCTIIAAPETADVYRAGAPHILFEPLSDFAGQIADERRRAALIGPGAGRDHDAALRRVVIGTVRTGKAVVLDADALNVFEGQPEALFEALHDKVVLTPHEGEFQRLFGDQQGDRAEKAGKAAKIAGAVIVLKGADTIIAHPDGRVIVNDHAAPWLATAGSGDVLAGMILGFLAQGMPPLDAACAAVWIHGEAGIRIGQGLVAPDLIQMIPAVLKDI